MDRSSLVEEDKLELARSLEAKAAAKGVTATPLYKKVVVDTAYPAVKPVADPLLANLTKSRYLAQLAAHIKPVALA